VSGLLGTDFDDLDSTGFPDSASKNTRTALLMRQRKPYLKPPPLINSVQFISRKLRLPRKTKRLLILPAHTSGALLPVAG
jgi:hypothetical protein